MSILPTELPWSVNQSKDWFNIYLQYISKYLWPPLHPVLQVVSPVDHQNVNVSQGPAHHKIRYDVNLFGKKFLLAKIIKRAAVNVFLVLLGRWFHLFALYIEFHDHCWW